MENHESVLKIGLVQMFCEKADISNNLRRHNDYVIEADSKSIDILAFPEASLTGYTDRGGYPEAIIETDGPEINSLCKMTVGRKITVLAGFIEKNPGGKPFVTQAVIRNGRLIGCYRKKTIIEDDLDWFSPGDAVTVFTHEDIKFGIAICSDLENDEIFSECGRQGARVVFECAAPGLYGERSTRDWQSGYKWWEDSSRKYFTEFSQKYGLWIAVATQAGRTIDEDFPGGGYVFAPNGERVYVTNDWQPGLVYLEIDFKNGKIKEI